MITFRSLRLVRGTKVLLDGASLMLPPRARAGIIGPNGSGKSSLFAALRGELLPDRGDIEMPAGWVMAHVAQETPAVDRTAIDYVMDGDPALRAAEAAIAQSEATGSGEEIALAHEAFGQIDGYTAPARAGALLAGLGFASAEHIRSVREFSGGWRMRLNLAQALMCRSDLLLLDEPTNHLDIDAIVWLEQWLSNYPGTLLVISHDREFLDGVASSVLAFENATLMLHTGDFSSYERARAERMAREQSLAMRQQREVDHLKSFIERFRAKATKARQAQSRMKALARMELIVPAHVADAVRFEVRDAGAGPDPALTLEGISAGYGSTPILRGVDLTITAGARIGLIGANGAGKTTLIKLLAGLLEPIAGERREGRNLAIGYFAQHQLEQLRPDDGPLTHLLRLSPKAREQDLRDHLGQFGFSGEAAFQPVGTMSGGEQSRLVLCMLIWQRPNMLLLDEPTNHLDMDTRETLTMALQGFEGAVVLVSHDRHLLRTTADELLVVADGAVHRFDGDLDDYRVSVVKGRSAAAAPAGPGARQDKPRTDENASAQQRGKGSRPIAAPSPSSSSSPSSLSRSGAASASALASVATPASARTSAAPRQAKQGNRARKPIVDRIARIESRLSTLNHERSVVDALLASGQLYSAEYRDKLNDTLADAARTVQAIEQLESEWLECQQALEELGTGEA